ncbi:MAG: MliC family protein [Desulfobulbaceae bacterium]|nr:MliC family protein [Desulfobulbaceae bacterium]
MAAILFISLIIGGCTHHANRTGLTVDIGQPVHYTSGDGDTFTARYGSLSDGSLHFVKVKMPDGREYTLPQVVSASGVRYTDEQEVVWWTHQGKVLVQTRGSAGSWQQNYPELRKFSGTN